MPQLKMYKTKMITESDHLYLVNVLRLFFVYSPHTESDQIGVDVTYHTLFNVLYVYKQLTKCKHWFSERVHKFDKLYIMVCCLGLGRLHYYIRFGSRLPT